MNFAFAGCGFLGIYHIGVASCLRQNAPHLLNGKVAGASAGAMVACLVLCDCPLGLCTRWTLRLATKARSRSLGPMHPTFDITQLLRDGLNEILPANAHEIVNGRLHVSMTKVSDGTNIMVTEFTSRDELIQALLCSAFIPFYSGLIPPLFRGERCVDGALSNNLPVINEYTVTVSPFAGRSDICPDDDCDNFLHVFLANTSIQFSVANMYRLSRIMFPPHPEKLRAICQRGFDDALLYLKRNELINCVRHITSQPRLLRSRTVFRGLSELDGTGCEAHGCPDCASSKEQTVELLPKTVVSALNEAIDVVNSSYLLYIKNTKFYRTFSIMCSPLYLPMDIALLTLSRLLRYLPRMTVDLHRVLRAVRLYASVLARRLADEGSCSYTARLVCRLAIREIRKNEVSPRRWPDDGIGSCGRTGRAVRSLNIGFDAGLTSGSLDALPGGQCEDDGQWRRLQRAPATCIAEENDMPNDMPDIGAESIAETAAEPVLFALDDVPIRSRAGSVDCRHCCSSGAGGGAADVAVTFSIDGSAAAPPLPRSRAGSATGRLRCASSGRPSRAASSELAASGAVLGYYRSDEGQLTVTEVYNVTELVSARRLERLAAAATASSRSSSGTATPRTPRPLPLSSAHRVQAAAAVVVHESILAAALSEALAEAARDGNDDDDAAVDAAADAPAGSGLPAGGNGENSRYVDSYLRLQSAGSAQLSPSDDEDASSWDGYLSKMEENLS